LKRRSRVLKFPPSCRHQEDGDTPFLMQVEALVFLADGLISMRRSTV
jgi:hypothetical protein